MERTTPVDLRSGHRVWVRSIEAGDAGELQRAFAQLSDLSRYRRFHTATPTLRDHQAKFFADVDHVDHEALVAFPAEQSSDIVAVARFIRLRDDRTDADLAITVADDWHGRGLGSVLLEMLSERARAVGIRRFVVDMLADNSAIRALVRAAGGEAELCDAHTVGSYIPLAPADAPLSARDYSRVPAEAAPAEIGLSLGPLGGDLPVAARARQRSGRGFAHRFAGDLRVREELSQTASAAAARVWDPTRLPGRLTRTAARTARTLGVAFISQVARPLLWREGNPLGALNLHSTTRSDITPTVPPISEALAVPVAGAVAGFLEIENVHRALATRKTIAVAIGLLMARYGLRETAAFAELQRRSSHANVKLGIIAAHIVAEVDEAGLELPAAGRRPAATC